MKHCRVLFCTALSKCLFWSCLSWQAAAADPGSANPSDPLWSWKAAHVSFGQAGTLISEKHYQEADSLLARIAAELPAPYSATAVDARRFLQQAFQRPVVGEVKERNDKSPDPFESTETTVLDYSFSDPILSGTRQLRQIAYVCSVLHCNREAGDVLLLSLKANYEDDYGDARGAMRAFANSDADDARFEALEKALRHDELRAECRAHQKSSATVRERFRKLNDGSRCFGFVQLLDHADALARVQEAPERLEIYRSLAEDLRVRKDLRGFEAWEEKRLADFGSDPAVKREIYLERERRARKADRMDEANRWERQLLAELPDEKQSHAALYDERASAAYSARNYAQAWSYSQKVFTEFPEYRRKPWAMLEGAQALKKLARYDDAIVLLKKLEGFPDGKVSAEFGIILRWNWKSYTCPLISECYEAKGEFLAALEYARMDQGFGGSGCLNCLLASGATRDLRLARLMLMAGKTEEGLKLAEELLNGRGGCDADAAELLVRHYRSQGKLDGLQQRLQMLEADHAAQLIKDSAGRQPTDRELRLPGAVLAREYAAILNLADRRDVATLWKRLEELTGEYEGGAFDFFDGGPRTSNSDNDWILCKVVEAIESLGPDARTSLLPKIHSHNRMQGWAVVFLAKQGSREALELVRGEIAAEKEKRKKREANGLEEEDDLAALRWDYVYALSFFKTEEAGNLLKALTHDPHDRWYDAAAFVTERLSQPNVDDDSD